MSKYYQYSDNIYLIVTCVPINYNIDEPMNLNIYDVVDRCKKITPST